MVKSQQMVVVNKFSSSELHATRKEESRIPKSCAISDHFTLEFESWI